MTVDQEQMSEADQRAMVHAGELAALDKGELVQLVLDLEQDARLFRKQVVRKAFEYAVRYNWCDQVKACLDELGIVMGNPRVTFKVVATYDVTAELPYDDLASLSKDPVHYLSHHLHIPSLLLTGGALVVDGEHEAMIDPEEVRVGEHSMLAPKDAS
jgi:hypothetical protein